MKLDRQFSTRELLETSSRDLFPVINAMGREIGDAETIRILDVSSAEIGRRNGIRQAQAVPETSFEHLISAFRRTRSGATARRRQRKRNWTQSADHLACRE
jgi:hypothetical protein